MYSRGAGLQSPDSPEKLSRALTQARGLSECLRFQKGWFQRSLQVKVVPSTTQAPPDPIVKTTPLQATASSDSAGRDRGAPAAAQIRETLASSTR